MDEKGARGEVKEAETLERAGRAEEKEAEEQDEARSFAEVLDAELDAIRESRRHRQGAEAAPAPFAGGDASRRATDARLAALAFSGGGIRSAAFNLGVAQGLARQKLLRRFDYLSINSGGGYVGGWLLAWIRRVGLAAVERELRTDACRDDEDGAEPVRTGSAEAEPVAFLRRFSNYLTPRVGAFSADTWTVVTTYLRNLLLNQAVLVLALGALLLLPRFLLLGSDLFDGAPATTPLWFSAAALAFALCFIGLNQFAVLRQLGEPGHSFPWFAGQRLVQATVVLPLFAAAWFACLWLWYSGAATNPFLADWLRDHWPGLLGQPGALAEPLAWAILAALVYLLCWLAGLPFHLLSMGLRKRWDVLADRRVRRLWAATLGFAPFAGAVGGVLLWAVARASGAIEAWLAPMGYGSHEGDFHLLHVNVWQAPAIVAVFILTAFVHTGLMGRAFPEALRQWWSRLGAWLLIWSLTWLGVAIVALYGSVVLALLGLGICSAIASGWAASTVGGVLVGRRASREAEPPPLWRRMVVAAAPQIFIVGLLLLVALGVHTILAPPGSLPEACPQDEFWLEEEDLAADAAPEVPVSRTAVVRAIIECQSARAYQGTTWSRVLLVFLLLGGGALGLSARVDINEFSMHLFYRNRLVRAFLGASNRRRRHHPFTGFDPADDVALSRLHPGAPGKREGESPGPWDGPYPLMNVALNLVAGEELAWQERKAASWVFAPLYSGFDVRTAPEGTGGEEGGGEDGGTAKRGLSRHGFRRTERYAQTPDGITMGTAMAISGAAASPSMGAGSTPAMAFLLTVFNVRLGWWLGNPRHPRTWRLMGPRVGLFALLDELFGATDQDSPYVYLSDGGHFDNLAIYELVRRRCRFIVMSDAGADPKVTFQDLGNAIRKCCIDFGIDVELDVARFRLDQGTRFSRWHCAVGRIRYDKSDPAAAPGLFFYLKASLTGDEPPDVLNYAADHLAFPHEPTSDQFFGESQFESYRKLGEHVAMSVFGRAGDPDELAALGLEELIVRLQEAWYPPSGAAEGAFTRHAGELDELFERLRTDSSLHFLIDQIYPEWQSLAAEVSGEERPEPRMWLPGSHDELVAGFFFCHSLIQLMETVYLDLGLENEYAHPDHRGWRNLFKHWTWSGMVRATWAVTAGTFGARFQTFCRRRLGFEPGRLEVEEHRLAARSVEKTVAALAGDGRLNFLEESLVRELCALNTGAEAPDRLLVCRMAVGDPTAEPGSADAFRFTFGFAVVRGSTLLFLRVQDHLRKMGLGRRALRRLVRAHGVTEVEMVPDERLPTYSRSQAGEARGDALRSLFRSVLDEVDAD